MSRMSGMTGGYSGGKVPSSIVDDETDLITETIGSFGRWQLLMCFIIFAVRVPSAWLELSNVFLAPRQNATCSDPNINVCSPDCKRVVYDCKIFEETIVSEWNLICSKEHLKYLSQTLLMFGVMVGNLIFGMLSDRYGRKIPFLIAAAIQLVAGLATSLVTWLWCFMMMRFLTTVGSGGITVVSFVLLTEIVGNKWRPVLGALYQIPYGMGYLTLTGIAYQLRHWRHMHLAVISPTVIIVVYICLLTESPMWLLARGETNKAVKVLQKAARINRRDTAKARDEAMRKSARLKALYKESQKLGIRDLLKNPTIRLNMFCLSINWFMCGLSFFGVNQTMGEFDENIYQNVTFVATATIPGTLVFIVLMNSVGRRLILVASNLMICLALVGHVFTASGSWPSIFLSCVGMFGIILSWTTVTVFSSEMFPTMARNLALGAMAVCFHIGSMVSPYVASTSQQHSWVPSSVFATIALIGAILCFFLPETRGRKMPDTLAELHKEKSKPRDRDSAEGSIIDVAFQNETPAKGFSNFLS